MIIIITTVITIIIIIKLTSIAKMPFVATPRKVLTMRVSETLKRLACVYMGLRKCTMNGSEPRTRKVTCRNTPNVPWPSYHSSPNAIMPISHAPEKSWSGS